MGVTAVVTFEGNPPSAIFEGKPGFPRIPGIVPSGGETWEVVVEGENSKGLVFRCLRQVGSKRLEEEEKIKELKASYSSFEAKVQGVTSDIMSAWIPWARGVAKKILSLQEPFLEVEHAVCPLCGSKKVAATRTGYKCEECSWSYTDYWSEIYDQVNINESEDGYRPTGWVDIIRREHVMDGRPPVAVPLFRNSADLVSGEDWLVQLGVAQIVSAFKRPVTRAEWLVVEESMHAYLTKLNQLVLVSPSNMPNFATAEEYLLWAQKVCKGVQI